MRTRKTPSTDTFYAMCTSSRFLCFSLSLNHDNTIDNPGNVINTFIDYFASFAEITKYGLKSTHKHFLGSFNA